MRAQKLNAITQMLLSGPDSQTTWIREVQTARWATNSTQRGRDQKIEYSSDPEYNVKTFVANGTDISQQRTGQQITPKDGAPKK